MSFTETVRKELCRSGTGTGSEARYLLFGAHLAADPLFTRHAESARRLLAEARRYPDIFGESRLERSGGRAQGFLIRLEKIPKALPVPEALELASALLKGAFLMRGYLSEPEQRCQFELRIKDEAGAQYLRKTLEGLDIKASVRSIRSVWGVYLRSTEAVSDLLGHMGAHGALLRRQSADVMKEMRSGTQRQVNCDEANIEKSRRTAQAQLEAIEEINRVIGIGSLPEALAEIAELRMRNEEAPLAELGLLCSPPIGKSGVNSRMKRLMDIAGKLRSAAHP